MSSARCISRSASFYGHVSTHYGHRDDAELSRNCPVYRTSDIACLQPVVLVYLSMRECVCARRWFNLHNPIKMKPKLRQWSLGPPLCAAFLTPVPQINSFEPARLSEFDLTIFFSLRPCRVMFLALFFISRFWFYYAAIWHLKREQLATGKQTVQQCRSRLVQTTFE